jgi:hypothetical protein
MRAAADFHDVRVPGNDAHAIERHAQPLRHQLGKGRLVTLAVGDDADHDIDAAVGMHRDLGALARDPGRGIDVVRDANAAATATGARLGAPCREARPVAEPERLLHGVGVVAVVVDQTERV